MEKELNELESKVKAQEDSLRKKNQREDELLRKIQIYEADMELKKSKIEEMNSKMVYYETFKHKFDTKTKESQMLLQGVEELSYLNGDL